MSERKDTEHVLERRDTERVETGDKSERSDIMIECARK